MPHRRAVVAAVSPERIAESFEIRALLETHLIEKVIERITPEQIQRLKGACNRMDELTDHHEWVAANAEFHRELLASAGSPLALELATQLSSQVERYLRLSGESVIRENEAGGEHRAIVAAVAARDVNAARRLIRTHIDHTRQRVVDAIGEEENS
jgi:DNA-binding GntR family transcriptional regulator